MSSGPRWAVLAASSFNTGCNALMFMDYASQTELSEKIYDVDATQTR